MKNTKICDKFSLLWLWPKIVIFNILCDNIPKEDHYAIFPIIFWIQGILFVYTAGTEDIVKETSWLCK